MRYRYLNAFTVLIFWFLITSVAQACNQRVQMTAPVAEFTRRGLSPMEALLQFGQTHDLCFGIEYVDRALLVHPSDFHIENSTVKETIETILGGNRRFKIAVVDGIVEIRPREPDSGTNTIFDIVIPKWETNRASVQLTSLALHMQLVMNSNPEIKGFAGDIRPGDTNDKVGPFSERNRTVRYLLDMIVAESKGGAWIADCQPRRERILSGSPAWTIVEYSASANYSNLLRAIACSPSHTTVTTSQ